MLDCGTRLEEYAWPKLNLDKTWTMDLFVKLSNQGLLSLVSLAQQLATPGSIDIGYIKAVNFFLYNLRI